MHGSNMATSESMSGRRDESLPAGSPADSSRLSDALIRRRSVLPVSRWSMRRREDALEPVWPIDTQVTTSMAASPTRTSSSSICPCR